MSEDGGCGEGEEWEGKGVGGRQVKGKLSFIGLQLFLREAFSSRILDRIGEI
jgi:hypothetical protein